MLITTNKPRFFTDFRYYYLSCNEQLIVLIQRIHMKRCKMRSRKLIKRSKIQISFLI